MSDATFRVFFMALVGLLVFAPNYALAQKADQKSADEAIQSFLSSQKAEREDAAPQASKIVDLNGDGKSEVVLVWTLLGPTYWSNTLTVFTGTATGYKPVASFPLLGEAKLASVKNGLILVDQMLLAKKDPVCCPSIKKQGKYRWLGKKIVEVKK